jgi:hypothetical protein
MEITNEKIYLELLKIKKLLHQSLDLEKEIEATEGEIKTFEGKQVEEERRLARAMKKKKFLTIVDWKRAIWDHCPAKKENVTATTISFYCDTMKGPCRFEVCPKNVSDDD